MDKDFKENSQAVQSHLTIIQNVINRMASNSSASKAWCITLVSAILVIIADKTKPDYAWIALCPTFLFLALDSYYLALEKGFRNSYNEFIVKLHEDRLCNNDLFVVVPKGNLIRLFFKSLISFSIWPFYIVMAVMILVAKMYIL